MVLWVFLFSSNVWKQKCGYTSALRLSTTGMMGGQGFQKGTAANESNLDANHGGRVKQQWLGSSSREAGERMAVGSGRLPGWKVEPRKSQIGVSEGQHSERNAWEKKMK